MKTLVLQHIACEPPGVFEDVLIERGAAITRVELDEGGQLPDWRDFELIVAMGGPMSVNDESEHPWLVAEKRLIREAVQAGVGYWGACLGVQLLASSLGARVYAGPQPEVGVLGVTLTDEGASDPVFAGLPRELRNPAVARRHVRPARGSGAAGRALRPTRTRPFATAGPRTACSSTSR